MRLAVLTLLVLVGYCKARPSVDLSGRVPFGSRIINGEDALPGEFPWQMTQQRLIGSTWYHSCGASLLSSTYALTAAHCIDGVSTTVLRVVAGVNDRTDPNGVISFLESYKLHEKWNLDGEGVFGNDIAILKLATPIFENGGSIQYASLPDNDDDAFVGRQGIIIGWGRTDTTTNSPIMLQKAEITVISFDQCNTILSPWNESATDKMICLLDDLAQSGACNYDSGGPVNVNYPTAADSRRVVAGVLSWSIIGDDNECLTANPSVYARTSSYLDWIAVNTP